MSSKYNCKKCVYETDLKFNFNCHLKTQKHLNRVNNLHVTSFPIPPERCKNGDPPPPARCEAELTPPNTSLKAPKHDDSVRKSFSKKTKTLICEYCQKPISYANHRARHYNSCRAKSLYDQEQLVARLNRLEKELAAKKAAESASVTNNNNNGTVNNIKNVDKRQMNVFYVTNNYPEAYNYEDLMSKKLTKREKNHIKNFGPSAGCERIIMDRCINGIPPDMRPIHCIDVSRDKFIYKTNGEWVVDLDGSEIMKPAMAHMRSMYDISENNKDIRDREG